MTVTDIDRDLEACSLAVTSEFDAAPDAVWQLWADPRRLERWWGPPTYPATFVEHDMRPGGVATYYMTSPEGDRYGGWWKFLEVDAPRSILLEDGFADEHGTPNDELPVTTTRVEVVARDGGGTTMRIRSTFPSTEAMQQMIEMGMEEGLAAAMGQIDGILAEIVA